MSGNQAICGSLSWTQSSGEAAPEPNRAHLLQNPPVPPGGLFGQVPNRPSVLTGNHHRRAREIHRHLHPSRQDSPANSNPGVSGHLRAGTGATGASGRDGLSLSLSRARAPRTSSASEWI